MKVRMNRSERETPFLSNLVKGEVHAETADGCNYSYGMAPYAQMPGMPQPERTSQPRMSGARSGSGRKTSVE